MKILLYIAKQFNLYFISILLILLSVDLIFYTINEFKNIGVDGYHMQDAILFVLLTSPRKVYALTPWVAMLATLLSLGNIAKHHELIVLQVAGISPWKIARMVLISSLPVLMILSLIGEVLAPKTEKIAQNIRMRGGSGSVPMIVTEDGVWVRIEQNFIQIMHIPDKNNLQDVTVFSLDQELHLKSITQAPHAFKVTGNTWTLNDPVVTTIGSSNVTVQIKESLTYDDFLNINVLDLYKAKYIERLSLTKLYSIIQQLSKDKLRMREYQVALWKKINQPLSSLMMILLAVPLAFASLRTVSVGARLIIGILIGFTFHTLNSMLTSFALLSNINVALISMLPSLLVLIISIFLFKRVNR